MTTFNKNDIDQCTDRCIVTLNHKRFTPDELNCFQKYLMLDLDALATYLRTLWADFDQIQRNSFSSSPRYDPTIQPFQGQ